MAKYPVLSGLNIICRPFPGLRYRCDLGCHISSFQDLIATGNVCNYELSNCLFSPERTRYDSPGRSDSGGLGMGGRMILSPERTGYLAIK